MYTTGSHFSSVVNATRPNLVIHAYIHGISRDSTNSTVMFRILVYAHFSLIFCKGIKQKLRQPFSTETLYLTHPQVSFSQDTFLM